MVDDNSPRRGTWDVVGRALGAGGFSRVPLHQADRAGAGCPAPASRAFLGRRSAPLRPR